MSPTAASSTPSVGDAATGRDPDRLATAISANAMGSDDRRRARVVKGDPFTRGAEVKHGCSHRGNRRGRYSPSRQGPMPRISSTVTWITTPGGTSRIGYTDPGPK